CLGAARLRLIAILPAYSRWQAHQDRLGAAAGLQAEQRSAVEHQVEFDVATATVQLELALALAPGHAAAALDDRQVGIEEGIADRALIAEAVLEAAFVEIIEEQPTDAAGFVAVAQEEVVVAGPLVRRIQVRSERPASALRHPMPVQHVLVERVERRQVETA